MLRAELPATRRGFSRVSTGRMAAPTPTRISLFGFRSRIRSKPVRNAALQGQEMKTFYESHPNFKTTTDQLPKTRPQDSARELVPNGDNIIGKGLERIAANSEPAEGVFKDVADQLNNEKQPVLRALKDLGEA